jgi:hypothetical protein
MARCERTWRSLDAVASLEGRTSFMQRTGQGSEPGDTHLTKL